MISIRTWPGRRALLVTAALALALSSARASTDVHPAAEYYPLQPGNSWDYVLGTDYTYTSAVATQTVPVNGAETVPVRGSDGYAEYLTNDAAGLALHRQTLPADAAGARESYTYSPAVPMLAAAAREGDVLESAGVFELFVPQSGTFALGYESESRVLSTYDVLIGAAEYRALAVLLSVRIFGEVDGEPVDETRSTIYLLARHIGKILRVTTTEGGITTIKLAGHTIDPDGDGIDSLVDNCPLVANPGQPDADSDGAGDACDPDAAGGGATDLALNVDAGGPDDRDAAVDPPGRRDDVVLDFGAPHGLWAWMDDSAWKQINPTATAGPVVLADLDGNGQDEVVADFGPDLGLWTYENDADWVQLNPATAAGPVVAGDIDGDGREDLVIDFGAGTGLWGWLDGGMWKRLNPTVPDRVLLADLDGDARDEVVADFGPGLGLWVLHETTAWEQINALPAGGPMAAGDLDGDGRSDLVVDLGAEHGLWAWMNDAAWRQLNPTSTAGALVLADLDADGRDEVIAGFGAAHGLWAYGDDTAWSQLNAVTPDGPVVAGDVDGSGTPDLVVDFGPAHGVWVRLSDSVWTQINTLSTTGRVALADLDENGVDDLVADFGPGVGTWVWRNGAAWERLNALSPAEIRAGDVDGR